MKQEDILSFLCNNSIWSYEHLRNEHKNISFAIKAIHKDKLVGIGCVGKKRSFKNIYYAELKLLGVDKEFRHKGIATCLKQISLNLAKEKDISLVYSIIISSNSASIALHEKIGYFLRKDKNNFGLKYYYKPE